MAQQRNRKTAVQQHKAQLAQEVDDFEVFDTGYDDEELWEDLKLRASTGHIIPIISNAVRNCHIFDIDDDGNVGLPNGSIKIANAAEKSIKEELAGLWAEQIGYPLHDKDKKQLPRVAQYNRVRSVDDKQAKRRYLNFIKMQLIKLAFDDEAVTPFLNELVSLENVDEQDKNKELVRQLTPWTFSHIVHDLGYPRYDDPDDDPLRILARLPIPIYITTSCHSFLERALQGQGKRPKTQICFWTGEPLGLKPEHQPDPDFNPTDSQPVVYHLYGFEDYPETLVLSEDDYLDYLIEFSGQSTNNRIIPPYLKGHLATSPLLLLGYRLQDWDFRILFRGILNTVETKNRDLSVAIQFDPEEQEEINNVKAAQMYLKKYFKDAKFTVFWDTTDTFITKLR